MPARMRDYAAEYARRQARARAQGYTSYWQQRQARSLDKELTRLGVNPRGRERLARRIRRGTQPAVQVRRLALEGERALRRKDHGEANRIARQLGYRGQRDESTGEWVPAESIFWYH